MYVGSSDAAIFNAMATDSPLCAQLSSSWTWTPADPNTDNPYFLEFAAQGQNLFQAAGDSSKWTTSGTASEIYPADDVYVTAVGGTDLGTSRAPVPGPQRVRGLMAAAAFRPTSTRCLPGRHRGQRLLQLLQELPQRSGRFSQCQLYLLRLRRPDHLHCQ